MPESTLRLRWARIRNLITGGEYLDDREHPGLAEARAELASVRLALTDTSDELCDTLGTVAYLNDRCDDLQSELLQAFVDRDQMKAERNQAIADQVELERSRVNLQREVGTLRSQLSRMRAQLDGISDGKRKAVAT